MRLRELDVAGYFEDKEGQSSEKLQIIAPADDLETDLLAWTLLPNPRTMTGDPARRGYVFRYELGRQVDDGFFALTVGARDAAGIVHVAEIAAALVSTLSSTDDRLRSFARFWFLSESMHYKPIENMSHEQYHGTAYGHLRFDASTTLPHRRMFGATV